MATGLPCRQRIVVSWYSTCSNTLRESNGCIMQLSPVAAEPKKYKQHQGNAWQRGYHAVKELWCHGTRRAPTPYEASSRMICKPYHSLFVLPSRNGCQLAASTVSRNDSNSGPLPIIEADRQMPFRSRLNLSFKACNIGHSRALGARAGCRGAAATNASESWKNNARSARSHRKSLGVFPSQGNELQYGHGAKSCTSSHPNPH